MPYSVRREELAALHADWAGILNQYPEPVPFLHPTWHRVWLEEFLGDRELLLLAVRDGESLMGVAPLVRENGRLSLVGHYSICDYMDFVVAPGKAGDVYPAILDALEEESWSELELRGLVDGSPTLEVFLALAEAAGLAVEREEEAVAPRVELPESWDEYLAGLSKKNRHELRRKLRRLGAAGELELRTYTTPTDVEEHLPVFLRLMVESRSDKATFMSEQMGRFFHRMAGAMAEEGIVRLYELELDTKPVASIFCFDQAGSLYLYNSGYDPQYAPLSVGLASKAFCLRDAMESGCRNVDFLRGDEPYKYDLGGKDRKVHRCVIRRA